LLAEDSVKMRSLAWIVLGLALLSTVRADDSAEDAEDDGELGENNSAEELAIQAGLNADLHLLDPECETLEPTDNEPEKRRLAEADTQCNDAANSIYGDCNCPEFSRCEFEGTTEELRTYFCRVAGPSDLDQYGNGPLLGELEVAQVSIVEGADKKKK